jgi:hypothetical protein
MKATIQFSENELELALQASLDGNGTIQNYIKAAVRYFNVMKAYEDGGKVCGVGDKVRFSTYNKEINPSSFLRNED